MNSGSGSSMKYLSLDNSKKNGLLSVTRITALLEVATGEKGVALLVPETIVIDIEDLAHTVSLGREFEVFFHQVAAVNAHGLFAAMRLVDFLLCESS